MDTHYHTSLIMDSVTRNRPIILSKPMTLSGIFFVVFDLISHNGKAVANIGEDEGVIPPIISENERNFGHGCQKFSSELCNRLPWSICPLPSPTINSRVSTALISSRFLQEKWNFRVRKLESRGSGIFLIYYQVGTMGYLAQIGYLAETLVSLHF